MTELGNAGGFRGILVHWRALEVRAAETVAAGTLEPISTRLIINRLFPDSVASRMDAQMMMIGAREIEWPVTTSNVTAGWACGETLDLAGP